MIANRHMQRQSRIHQRLNPADVFAVVVVAGWAAPLRVVVGAGGEGKEESEKERSGHGGVLKRARGRKAKGKG